MVAQAIPGDHRPGDARVLRIRRGKPADPMDPTANRGLDYIASCARQDGGIYCEVPTEKGGSLANYNTAASLLGSDAARETQFEPLILAARGFLVRTQHLDKDDFYGGWGYDATARTRTRT